MEVFDLPLPGLEIAWTKVAYLIKNLRIILSYPLAGLFEYLYNVYVLAAQTSALHSSPKFKTVHQRV